MQTFKHNGDVECSRFVTVRVLQCVAVCCSVLQCVAAGIGSTQHRHCSTSLFVFNVYSCLSTAFLIYFHVFLCIYWSLLPHMRVSGALNVSFVFERLFLFIHDSFYVFESLFVYLLVSFAKHSRM